MCSNIVIKTTNTTYISRDVVRACAQAPICAHATHRTQNNWMVCQSPVSEAITRISGGRVMEIVSAIFDVGDCRDASLAANIFPSVEIGKEAGDVYGRRWKPRNGVPNIVGQSGELPNIKRTFSQVGDLQLLTRISVHVAMTAVNRPVFTIKTDKRRMVWEVLRWVSTSALPFQNRLTERN
jgi:hypothetical protein